MKRRLTLGKYPVVSVEDDRKLARQALASMANGINPFADKRQDRASSVTLNEVLVLYLASKELYRVILDKPLELD